MKLRLGVLSLVTALALAGGTSAAYADGRAGGGHGGRPLIAHMTGAQETPPNNSPGTGTAKITVNIGHGEVCWVLTVQNLEGPVTAAHIHFAPIGVAGPIVVPLSPPTTGLSKGCRTVDRALAKNIVQHPQEYYVNVHTTVFPEGEIRGQLQKR
jgi:hypothetical protein